MMLAMETLGMREPECSALEYLRRQICRAMAQAVEDNRSEKEAGNLLAGRLNHLRDEIKKLTDELEREISVEELAVYLDMPAEEILDLLKLREPVVRPVSLQKERSEPADEKMAECSSDFHPVAFGMFFPKE